jgi:plastocyanin
MMNVLISSILFSIMTVWLLLAIFLSNILFFNQSFPQENKQIRMTIDHNFILNAIVDSERFIFTIPLAVAIPTNDTSFLPDESSISIGSTSFFPSEIQVPIGSKVSWTNNDSTLHTVTEENPERVTTQTKFDSDILYPDQTWNYTFNSTGTFNYHCTIHPFMEGTVIVT